MKKKDIAILSIEEKRELLKKLLLNKQVNDAAWQDTQSSKLNGQSISNKFDSTSKKKHEDEPASILFNQGNVIIESMGVYLPEKSVPTQTILDECSNKLSFPLGRMTGIESRRMAGDHEFAIDLAQKAIDDCFAHSTYCPEDIDLLISCNISRYDGPELFSFEPNTSSKLVKHFEFLNALSFDISNACAGFFTAIQIAESFIKNGTVRRALIVSGEYITHLTNTAQKEIDGFMDSRLACLTLGDAGAAVILEKSSDDKMGLLELDLFTEGKYHPLCVAKVTEADHGGAIMFTDSIGMTTVSLNQAVAHADFILNKRNWGIDSADFVIMHQTSELAINSAIQTTNDFYNKKLCTPANTLINLTTRGNTASTSQFVALYDFIKRHRINNNDKIIFSIAASGRTIGTALYALDDLPDKIRQPVQKKKLVKKINGHKLKVIEKNQNASRVKIESVGLINEGLALKRDVIEIAKISAENCLSKSAYERNDINLLMYSGIYRNEFILEPAIAAILAGELNINEEITSPADAKTFAFDVFNGGNGLLNACYIAVQFIRTKKYRNSMIVTAEIENNADIPSKKLVGLQETSSALLLDESKTGNSGFGNFVFKNYTKYIDTITTYAKLQRGQAYLHLDIDPNSEDYYISCIPDAVNDLLAIERIDISDIKAIFPPQVSSSFISKLSDKMNIDKKRLIDITDGKKDLFNSSFPYALEYAKQQNMVSAGDIGLIINISSGIQVGCAIYYF